MTPQKFNDFIDKIDKARKEIFTSRKTHPIEIVLNEEDFDDIHSINNKVISSAFSENFQGNFSLFGLKIIRSKDQDPLTFTLITEKDKYS